jgi:hypothetical protein
MSFIRSFVAQSPLAITRELILVVAIVALATLATLIVAGPGAGVPFDTRLDQLPLPF